MRRLSNRTNNNSSKSNGNSTRVVTPVTETATFGGDVAMLLVEEPRPQRLEL